MSEKISTTREFEAEDPIWIKNELKEGWREGAVVQRSGDLSYRVVDENREMRKHADQLRARSVEFPVSNGPHSIEDAIDNNVEEVKEIVDQTVTVEPVVVRRSTRERKPTARLIEEF